MPTKPAPAIKISISCLIPVPIKHKYCQTKVKFYCYGDTMSDTRYTIPLFALGIILRYYWADLCFPLFFSFTLTGLFAVATYFCRFTACRYVFIGCLALSSGISYATWRLSFQHSAMPPLTPGHHLFRGHIVSLPEQKAESVRFHFVPENSPYHLLISSKRTKNTPHFLPGQLWELGLKLPVPHTYLNPGGIDFLQWHALQGIDAQAYLQSATLVAPASHTALIHQLRAHLQHKIEQTLGPTPQAHIICALTIGDQSRITEEQWRRFRQTGIIHLVSISGVHVTMLAGLVTLICRRVFSRIPGLIQKWPVHKPALLVGLIVALAYAILAGFSVPTQRTIFMLCASVWALLSSKNLTALQIWLSALFAVLIWEPIAVLSIGFWLSFLCVGALILSSIHLLRPPTGLRLWIKSQWIASIASLPTLAILFQAFPLLSPIANAVAIPLVSILVTPLALLGLLDPSGYLLHIAEYLLIYQDYFLDYLLRLPHTYHFNAPPFWTLFPACFGTLLLLLPSAFPLRYWAWIGFLPLFLLSRGTLENGQWRAVVIDVGQGLSVLIQTRQHQLVFDTGKKAAAKPALMAVLHHYGTHKLDTLILSHDDNDHTGGAELLMQAIPVTTLLSSLSTHHPLQELALQTTSCLTPSSWTWDDVHFTLMPTPEQFHARDDNGKSCILKVHTPALSMLIPGDVGFKEEAALISTYRDELDVDIVVAPHHGSKYASSKAFIEATSPRWAIFSAGRHNRYRHPHPNTLARYQAQGSEILRTDQVGAILIHSSIENNVTGFADKQKKSTCPP
jgi:competence protein ComEC